MALPMPARSRGSPRWRPRPDERGALAGAARRGRRKPLTRAPPGATSVAVPGGWATAGEGESRSWRKVRAPREYGAGQRPAGRSPARGEPQGKCHREQTATAGCEPSRGKGERVGQEPTAPPATGAAWQTPPGARPNRGGRRSPQRCGWTQGHSRPVARVGRVNPSVTGGPEEWSSNTARCGQNPAYRPPGTSFPHGPATTPAGLLEQTTKRLARQEICSYTLSCHASRITQATD